MRTLPLTLLGILLCSFQFAFSQQLNAKFGKLDAREVDLRSSDQTLRLDGQWEFYWGKLLSPGDQFSEEKRNFIEVPSVWNDHLVDGKELSGEGYATYRLQVALDNPPDLLSIELPNVYTSYRLYINGKLVSQNGVVGETKAASSPQWKPQLKIFNSTDTLEIICQVANFYHRRGGIHKPITIGNFNSISNLRESKVMANMLLTGGLIALGFFFIVFYLLRIKEKAALYFGLFCLAWAVRSVFSNIYLVGTFFDSLDWSFALHIEYLSLYVSVMLGILFMAKAFDPSDNQLLKYLLSIINFIFISLTVILPTLYFTRLLPAYQIFMLINLIFAGWIIVRAVFEKKTEAWFSAIAVLLGISIFGYEVISYMLVAKTNYILLNLGYLAVFFLNSLVLAYRFVDVYKKADDAELQLSKAYSIKGKLRI